MAEERGERIKPSTSFASTPFVCAFIRVIIVVVTPI